MTTIQSADVLRMQADLRDKFRDTVFCNQILHLMDFDALTSPDALKMVVRAQPDLVGNAKSYRVESHMTDAIVARAKTFDPNATVVDPPSQTGFVVFEEPIILLDTQRRRQLIHVLSWHQVNAKIKTSGEIKRAIQVFAWNDTYREPDDIYRDDVITKLEANDANTKYMVDHSGRWSMIVGRFIPYEWPLGPWAWDGKAEIHDGMSFEEMRDMAAESGGGGMYLQNTMRIVSALFDMLGERIPATKKESIELTRTERKLAKREGLAPEVITVTLRPEYDPDKLYNTGTGRKQHVRSCVGNPDDPDSVAYYRTLYRGTPRERRVPVRSHYRGPADGPPAPPKVYTLGR